MFKKSLPSLEEQVETLKSHGMQISDDAGARASLARIGYTRLSEYWYPFLESIPDDDSATRVRKPSKSDKFKPGTRFSDVLEFYVFDKRLRLIVLDALERVEIGIRAQVVNLLREHGGMVHRDADKLHGNFSRRPAKKGASRTKHEEWLWRLDKKFQRSRAELAEEFKQAHPGENPPIWIAAEVWDFGTLSRFFEGMKLADRNSVATMYGLPNGQILESWIINLNDVRNVCAHHSRLWNRGMPYPPAWPSAGHAPALDHLMDQQRSLARFYASAVMLRYLLQRINPSTSWPERLKDHIAMLPNTMDITLHSAGFPKGWETEAIWTLSLAQLECVSNDEM